MDAFACKLSSLTGLGFAIGTMVWRSKFPACKAAYSPSVITIIAFALGTIGGLIASTVWLQFAGTQVLSALRSAGFSALFYSPLYVVVMIAKVDWVARHMLMTVVAVTVTAAGILFGSYLWYYNSIQAAPFNTSVIVVCTTINGLGVLVGLQKADVGALFGFLVDIVLFGTLGLSIEGIVTQSDLLCVPFLTLSALVMGMCSWFMCRTAIGCHRTLPQLMDRSTGALAVPQPRAGSPRPLPDAEGADAEMSTETRKDPTSPVARPSRPTVTFPPMALQPPTEEFLAQTRHLFVLPNYNENPELLETTLRVLTTHPGCQQRYAVLLAMEASEAGGVDKACLLEEKVRASFCWVGHTVHQLRAGELAGKGSNLNSALQQLLQLEWAAAKPDSIMVTVMDSDTILSPEYIAGVDAVWASHPKAVATALLCPTTPLVANWRESPFVVRFWELIYFSCINGQMAHSGNLRMPMACYSLLLTIPDEIGFWDSGLSGIAEDQHTALRTYLHFKRKVNKGQIIAVLAPYWGQCETSFRTKARQQIRHFFGIQDVWYALARSTGLSLKDRVHVSLTVASPILMAIAVPIVAAGTNLICTYGPSLNIRLLAFLVSALSIPQAPAAAMLIFYIQYLWAFSEGVPVPERRGFFQILKILIAFPVVFATQYVCGLYAKLWLLFAELGLSRIVYEGARQGASRSASPA